MPLRFRRGTDVERLTITPEEGEPIYVTDTKKLFVGDGATAGGVNLLAANLSDLTIDDDVNLSGYNLIGADSSVIYDSATGTLSANSILGNVTGSVLGDNSTLLVDATNNSINLDGTVRGNVIPDADSVYDLGSPTNKFKDLYLSGNSLWVGNAQISSTGSAINLPAGSTIGGVTVGVGGEILPGNSLNVGIIGDDSSLIVNVSDNEITANTVITDVIEPGNLFLDIGSDINPASVVFNLEENLRIRQSVSPTTIRGYITSEIGRGTIDNPNPMQPGDDLGGLLVKGYNGVSYAIGGIISFFVDPTSSITPGSDFIKTQVAINASTDSSQNESDALILDSAGVVTSNAFVANNYMQIPVYNNDTDRDASLTSPTAGMIIFNARDDSTDIPSFQGYDGDSWLDGLYGADSSRYGFSGTVTGSMIPDTNEAYDLGSSSKRFRDLYLSGSSINLGGVDISAVGGELQLDGVKIATQNDITAPAGDITGSVFGDDSTLLVDGVRNLIVGEISTQHNLQMNQNDIEGLYQITSTTGTHSITMIDGAPLSIVSTNSTDISGDITLGGSSKTIDFVSGTTVDFANTTVNNLPNQYPTRNTASDSTSSSHADGTDEYLDLIGHKGYALLKIQTDDAAWVRIYTSDDARTTDAARLETTDPAPDAGVIAEVITTGAEAVVISPGAFGFNDEDTPTTTIPIAVRNKSGGTQSITVTLTILQMEA